MTNALTEQKPGALAMPENEVVGVLRNSLYPGAKDESIYLVLDYCRAAGLDPMQKPVHIVPMYDKASGGMRDVIMPGVGLYRTQAARTGQFAGMSEPEFGPVVHAALGGHEIDYPEWAKVTVKRALSSGIVAEFTAVEYWVENYAVKGGKERSIAPNAMWAKRPRGQIAKCAAAQALRIAFPELGAQPTADEMEGKTLYPDDAHVLETKTVERVKTLKPARFQAALDAIRDGTYTAQQLEAYSLTMEQETMLEALCEEMAAKQAAESEPTDA